MNRWTWIGLCLAALPGWAAEAPPTSSAEAPEVSEANGRRRPAFARKPTASRAADGKVKIEFAVDRETDVAVFIENGGGKVVRHLVAGALGKNPPPPLKPGLAQSIEWDGKADWGKPLPSAASGGGGFKVRVALGLGAQYDKVLAGDPANCGRPRGIGLGPDGTLYVAGDVGTVVNWAGLQLSALNRDGSYKRTLIPVPAGSTKEHIEFLGGAAVQIDGRPVPVVTNLARHQTTAFWPDEGGGMAVTSDGTLLVPQDGSVCAVPTGSTLPAGRYAGGKISAAGKPAEFSSATALAVSADGQWVYVSGLTTDKGKAGVPAVLRVKLPERSGAEPFFGDPAKAGKDEKHLASPCGLARDGRGHLLVADTDNDRVVVVSEKDGGFAGSFAVDKPQGLAVDPKTGAVYVVRPAGKGGADLVKFDGWKTGKEVGKTPLATAGAVKYTWHLAVDASASPAVLWAAHTRIGLRRVEDCDGKLAVVDPPASAEGDLFGGQGFLDVNVDHYRAEPEVYARTRGGDSGYAFVRFSEATGKFEKLILDTRFINGAAGTCLVPGPEEKIYALCEGLPGLFKFDRGGKALPWDDPHPAERELASAGQEERYIERYRKTDKFAVFVRVCMVYMTHTMGVRHDGQVFAFDRGPKTGHRGPKALYEFAPSGKRVGGPIIWTVSDNAVGPRLDQEGNIYIAEAVKPADQPVPPEYADFVGPVKVGGGKPAGGAPLAMYGSIVKFSPKGGTIAFPDGKRGRPYEGEPKLDPALKTVDATWCSGGTLHPVKVTGAEWVRLGVSHVEFPYCNCENVRFDVDPFGRVWYPDLGRYRVGVLDTNGNEIVRFGGYGNAQSKGPESADKKLAEPGIAFSWLTGVGATDRYAYVGDALNRRLLRARLVYAAEETCPVP